jgi:DNA repair photolyase
MIAVKEIEVKSIITKTGIPSSDYVINPYVGCPHKCLYCYAEFMKRFTNHSESWGDFLDVKRYAKRIDTARLADKKIVFSSVTDAYNPFEKKYRVTREILLQFADTRTHIDILTKSDLVLRDIDIFARIPNIRVGVSLSTLDDSVRKKLEPFASSIENRIGAVKTLRGQGIRTFVFLSPMFPVITDFKAILSECKPFADEFWFENLNLRGTFRPAVMRYIRENRADLVPLYEDIYKFGNVDYWKMAEAEIASFCTTNNIAFTLYFYHEKIRK